MSKTRTLEEASARVARAQVISSPRPRSYYADVKQLIHPFDSPALFWRNWCQKPGVREVNNILKPVSLEETEGMTVVLVDRIGSAPQDLLDGVERLRQNGTSVIILITHRIQFAEDDLKRLGNLAVGAFMRIMVTHSYENYEDWMEKHCPGVFMTLPHVA